MQFTKLLGEAVHTINDDLDQINCSYQQLNLKLNPSKSKAILFMNAAKARVLENDIFPYVRLDDNIIHFTDSVKYLDVDLDQRLSFNNHVDSVEKRLGMKSKVLKRVRSRIPRQNYKEMVSAYVSPFIDYCCHIWRSCDPMSPVHAAGAK